jgi:hypothetical protein
VHRANGIGFAKRLSVPTGAHRFIGLQGRDWVIALFVEPGRWDERILKCAVCH